MQMEKPRLRGATIILEGSCRAVVPRGGFKDRCCGKRRSGTWGAPFQEQNQVPSSWQSSLAGRAQFQADSVLLVLKQHCTGSWVKVFLMAFIFALHIPVACGGEGALALIWQKLISLSGETSHIRLNMALSPPLI